MCDWACHLDDRVVRGTGSGPDFLGAIGPETETVGS